MERTGPLNDRQLEALQLVGSGDDLSSTEREPLRITARALESRGLVSISKSTGQWRATITADGRFYLEHGYHPDARRTSKDSGRTTEEARTVPSPGKAVKPRKTREIPTEIPRDRRADAIGLINRLSSERTVRLPALSESEFARWRKTVDHAKRNGLVPEGHHIEFIGSADTSATIRLIAAVHPNAARKHAQGLEPVPVPERLQRPHPVVARLRDDVDRLTMPKDLRRRSLLIFQAIASAAHDRGWKVRDQPVDQRHHYGSGSRRRYDRREGAVQVGIDGFTYAVTIDQEFPQSENPIKAKNLKLELPYSSYGQHKWADRKTMTLEDRLPEVMDGLAKSAAGDRRSAIAAEKAKVERQRQWETVMANAKVQALEHHYASALEQQSQAFERFKRLTAYCDLLEERLQEEEADHPDNDAARQWLAWARTFADSTDPLRTLPAMPTAPEFKAEDLKPFLGRWSPYGPESSYGRR
ncbi:hypothetical protein [Glycomyces buryatensis]|uniref:PE-PGRS family protein n=1 Tax=Glycomyces buryatensis TaxID=2570927 RepID=A0A4S8QIG7_9ACTN|nr:hypothetical protein [Glycomyces buryatensis]THV41179.1 hypothetical protein FAB82_13085 [Glycomyces buryatensis]